MAGVADWGDLVFSDVSARLTHRFKPGFMEVLNDEATLWNLLPKNRAVGPLVEWKCHYGCNANYITLYADFAIYTRPVEITDPMSACDAAAGHGDIRVWADESARAAAEMKQDIEKGLWSKQAGHACLGIQDVIDDSHMMSYGGKSRWDYPCLRAVACYGDGTPRPLTLSMLRDLARGIRHGTGVDIVGNNLIFRKEDRAAARSTCCSRRPTSKIPTKGWLHKTVVTRSRRSATPLRTPVSPTLSTGSPRSFLPASRPRAGSSRSTSPHGQSRFCPRCCALPAATSSRPTSP